MSAKYTVRAPNGRSVNIKCDLGRFEFIHGEELTDGQPHDVKKLAGIFPTIFVEKVEVAPVVPQPVVLPEPEVVPEPEVAEEVVEEPLAADPGILAQVEAGEKSVADMTDEEIAAAAAAVLVGAGNTQEEVAKAMVEAKSLRSTEKPDELDKDKVEAKLREVAATKTAAKQKEQKDKGAVKGKIKK